jgi:hypothetical protein
MFDLRLINAEILKLRRRRGMLAIALLCTVGFAALAFIVTGIQHAGNPTKHGPAGGLKTYRDALGTVEILVLIMGTIVGATAGTQDIESGVFRDLAATGRSRLALFGARVVGAWAVVLPILAVTAGLTAASTVALAGSLEAPGAGALTAGTAAVLVSAALSTATAVGLSALIGSRGPVIGILLAFYLAVQPLLEAMGLLGNLRHAIPEVAVNRIGDVPAGPAGHVALVTAILVVVAWSAVALGLGAWRTKTREI